MDELFEDELELEFDDELDDEFDDEFELEFDELFDEELPANFCSPAVDCVCGARSSRASL